MVIRKPTDKKPQVDTSVVKKKRDNKGKKFEVRFKEDFESTFPDYLCYRLKDDVSHKKGSARNPCDFFCFIPNKLFLTECKSHKGNTFPFTGLRQYDDLKNARAHTNVYPCVIIWFIDHNKVLFMHIDEIIKMKEIDNKKSLNIKDLKNPRYNIIDVPSKKLQVYMKSDYSFLERIAKDEEVG